jgi:TfoX/Sxy family transcriptional regulator of competence genes
MDINLADRLRNSLRERNIVFEEKKMFGGLAFMVNTHMTVGITNKNALMVRCLKDGYQKLLGQSGASPMIFTGRPMAGFLFVDLDAIDKDEQLAFWVDIALDFALNTPQKNKK